MANVAFFIYGIGSLKGGGGAERFFADFFDKYQDDNSKKFGLYYLMDEKSKLNLNEVGKLKKISKVLNFKVVSNRYKHFLEVLQLYYYIVTRKIEILHIPLYSLSYLPLLQSIDKLPRFLKPRLVINIVHCGIAQILNSKDDPAYQSIATTYFPLLKEVKVDGYFCWNKSFENYVTENNSFVHKPKIVRSITSRFSDVEKYFPEKTKQNWIIFASRLDKFKHPEWMLEAILSISINNPELLKVWRFKICGDGPLRESLFAYCKTNKLDDYVDFVVEGEMYKILNSSKIYVSCQDFDNFPSLTMAEAMASGNAIITRNVGQTNLFVKDKLNGLLIHPDNVDSLANTLVELMKNEVQVMSMALESIKLIKEVHNVKNFTAQIEAFWEELLLVNEN